MGRRSDHTREELKEMFIEAGRALVLEEGHQAVNARGIAARIGYSVGTLYNVFENLGDLVMHINLRTLDGLQKRILEEKSSRTLDGEAVAKVYLDYATTNAPLWRLVFEYQVPEGDAFPEWWIDKVNENFKQIEDILRPEFGGTPEELHQVAKVYWMGLHGISMLALSGRLAAAAHEPAEFLAGNLHRYLLAGHKALTSQ